MTDKILLYNCKFSCNLGVYEEERNLKQYIFIDLKLFFDIKKATESDSIEETINYVEVHQVVKNLIENKSYKLIETMSEEIAEAILQKFKIEKIIVRIKKPQALKDVGVEWAGVEIIRSLN